MISRNQHKTVTPPATLDQNNELLVVHNPLDDIVFYGITWRNWPVWPFQDAYQKAARRRGL
jgi:hypothetical protein